MDRSSLLIGAVVIFFFCAGIAVLDSSNVDVSNSAALMKKNDIVIDTVHDYLQKQEKRLAYLRKHIEEYSRDHEKSIREIAKTYSAATQENSVNDDEKVKKDADTDDAGYHVSQDNLTKYEKLCNGEIFLPARIQKKLKCRYVDHAIPFLKIAPFKEEEAYLDPRIVVYHDVIFEAEIETFKRLSKPRLEPAAIINQSNEAETNKHRISKIAWLKGCENEYVNLLNRRVEHMTGLTVDTGEKLQIGYYDIGGLFLEHHDFFGKETIEHRRILGGDRIATVLFYMNDVAEGGGTSFLELNVTIWPKKGSAVFWHNLKRNGEGEDLTLHAGCRVLSGTKWIATKWLHEAGQEFRRPCTLLENE